MAIPTHPKFSRRERGMTFLGVVALLVGIATVITLLMRLGPHYLDWTTMDTILDDLAGAACCFRKGRTKAGEAIGGHDRGRFQPGHLQ